ncbi:MAG: D-glycero-beta-D-manno-heptose 1-phosphate adenylyltransferase [Deltaproteobacteria bacterium]|nr:D-glycero-beta-D-manno-heptose 1-phosphate adenylyltransferase [Deltaproteobacteria bacterium]MCB9489457.1 D-glycero-beta-D-manno-heptose 1-phosphate adenylyltransferase [Deltaproteobacteria bacterium]
MPPLDRLAEIREDLRRQGKTVAFTNGVYDLLHSGHVRTLRSARSFGDVLILAINSDRSVREIKGPKRPIVPERERAEVLAGFEMVDFVVVFDEPDPGALIDRVIPDVLVKGGDWGANAIIGRETVEAHGGRVERVPVVEGRSTTNIIAKVSGLAE